ncbi:MAG: GerAB/ArcD/ProY family transporter, partial [Clostridia bacterium]|nr:GerAB/ArcD/ProY family transporter [Clostridia bacterium]
IAIGVVGLLILGVSTTDLTEILPITETVLGSVAEGVFKSTLWFGNFTVLYVLMGKIKDQENKKWSAIKLSFFLSSLFVVFSYVVFYGIYGQITPLKRNWLTKVSQFALLSLDIGRIDWFFILFAELATILTAGIFVYCSAYCFKEVFKPKKFNMIIYIILFALYLNTNFIVKSKLDIFRVLITVGPIYGIVVQYVLPFVLLLFARKFSKRQDTNKSLEKFKRLEQEVKL